MFRPLRDTASSSLPLAHLTSRQVASQVSSSKAWSSSKIAAVTLGIILAIIILCVLLYSITFVVDKLYQCTLDIIRREVMLALAKWDAKEEPLDTERESDEERQRSQQSSGSSSMSSPLADAFSGPRRSASGHRAPPPSPERGGFRQQQDTETVMEHPIMGAQGRGSGRGAAPPSTDREDRGRQREREDLTELPSMRPQYPGSDRRAPPPLPDREGRRRQRDIDDFVISMVSPRTASLPRRGPPQRSPQQPSWLGGRVRYTAPYATAASSRPGSRRGVI